MRGVLVVREVVRARDEIGERVLLGHHPAAFVPRFAEFAAAADVRDGVDHPPLQQRDACGRERGVFRDAV